MTGCEGGACPIKAKCQRYADLGKPETRKFLIGVPFKRDACAHYEDKGKTDV